MKKWVVFGFIFLSGFLFRSAALLDNFWLDEIWAYYLAFDLDSFFSLLGPDAEWVWYRMLAFSAGCVLLIFPLWKSGKPREYAPALLMSVLGYHFSERIFLHKGKGDYISFWLVSVIGFLSHLTYVYLFMSAGTLYLEPSRKGFAFKRSIFIETYRELSFFNRINFDEN